MCMGLQHHQDNNWHAKSCLCLCAQPRFWPETSLFAHVSYRLTWNLRHRARDLGPKNGWARAFGFSSKFVQLPLCVTRFIQRLILKSWDIAITISKKTGRIYDEQRKRSTDKIKIIALKTWDLTPVWPDIEIVRMHPLKKVPKHNNW